VTYPYRIEALNVHTRQCKTLAHARSLRGARDRFLRDGLGWFANLGTDPDWLILVWEDSYPRTPWHSWTTKASYYRKEVETDET
jgi:hypothetical protein